MNIGYARVSSNHQNLDRQIALLKRAGCKKIFKEKRSGREGIKRPQLNKAIDALSPGDVLIVAEWDRATRSLLDGIQIIERIAAKGAMLKARASWRSRCPVRRRICPESRRERTDHGSRSAAI
jgi:DNA invertase Pin-like site-specific DNA recombinase